MSIFNKKRFKRSRRPPEQRKKFFRPRKIARGPKIYLPGKKTVRFEYFSTFWPKFYLFILIILISGLLYIIFLSSLFKIEKIALLGGNSESNPKIEKVINKELGHKILFILPANHYFLLNTQKISSSLKNKFPEIKEIKFNRKFPNLLKVSIKLKNFKFTWVQGDLELKAIQQDLKARLGELENKNFDEISSPDQCPSKECKKILANPFYKIKDKKEVLKKLEEVQVKEKNIKYFLIDQDGELGREIQKEEINLPLVCDRSAQPVHPNLKPLPQEYFSFITELFNNFSSQTNLQIEFLCIPSKQAKEAFVKTKQGLEIYFNASASLKKQFSILNQVFAQANQAEEKIKEYIDLRIEGKIYYK